MFELISKFWKRSELPACEPDLILKTLSYDELRLIFDFLSLKELVKCRPVCKRFRSVVDSIRLRELFVFDRWSYGHQRWFYSGRLIHSRNSVTVKRYFWSLYNRVFWNLGQNLKFLGLKLEIKIEELEKLNSYLWLEELWILQVEHWCSDDKATLRLPNLKKLAFSLQLGSVLKYPSVILDTPLLEDVRVESGFPQVQFKFGATVKRLQMGNCKRTFELLEQFLEFKNLECFSCTDPAFLDAFDILKFKPDLKRIDCYRHESGKQFDVIKRLLEQRAKWSLPVEIYFES